MIIDFHTHIFPPVVVADRERFLQRDPVFAALYRKPTAKLATAEDLLRSMDSAKVDVSVALGFAWRDPELCRLHNEYLLESALRSGGRIVPFLTVQPAHPDLARQEIERGRTLARGIGELRPDDQGYELDGPAGALLVEASAGGLILLFHVSEPVGHAYPGKEGLSLSAFYHFLQAHPGVAVVGAHWAGGLPFYGVMPEVRSLLERVYVDTASTPLLYEPTIYRLVTELLSPKRILFGSDFPLLSQRGQLQRLAEAPIDDRSRALIQGSNAARLLRIGQPPTGCTEETGAEQG